MITNIRAVEWQEGRRLIKQTRWGVQIQRDGSRKWEFIKLVFLDRKPKEDSRAAAKRYKK